MLHESNFVSRIYFQIDEEVKRYKNDCNLKKIGDIRTKRNRNLLDLWRQNKTNKYSIGKPISNRPTFFPYSPIWLNFIPRKTKKSKIVERYSEYVDLDFTIGLNQIIRTTVEWIQQIVSKNWEVICYDKCSFFLGFLIIPHIDTSFRSLCWI